MVGQSKAEQGNFIDRWQQGEEQAGPQEKKKFKSAPKARATEQGDPFVVGSPTSHGSSASREMLTARSFAHSASPELLCPSA